MARVEFPKGVEKVTEETLPDAIEALANALAGSASNDPEFNIEWMLGPQFKGKWDDPDRKAIIEFFSSLAIRLPVYFNKANPTNIAVAARAEDGKIGAVLLASKEPVPLYQKSCPCCVDCGACLKLLCAGLLPPWRKKCSTTLKSAGPGMEKRMKVMASIVDPIHAKDAPSAHWYLSLVGVDPKYQGQGLGGKLVRHLSVQADADKLPCYLQCTGLRNPKIYEKCGYVVVGNAHEIACDADEEGSWAIPDFYSMSRPALSSVGHPH